MVLQKRVGYEFNGYRVPNVPRGSRSIRGKRRAGKSAVENKMCAFELLASVAGELLLQKESSPARSDATNGGSSPLFSKGKAVKEEREDEQKVDPDRVFRECLQPGSIVIISDPPEKVGFGEESVFNRLKSEFPRSPRLHQGAFSLKAHSPSPPGTCLGKVEEGIPTPPHYERARNGNESHGYASEEVEKKPLLHLASSCGPGAADCEKSSVSNETGTGASKHLRPQRIGDRRIRKFWASRFWKVSPTLLKDGEFSDKDEDVKPLFYSRKMYYKRQRSQKLSFKRKRFFQRGSLSSSDLPINGEGLPCSPEMQIKGEASSLDTGGNGGALSPTGSQKFTFDSNDYQVKLSIKSFKVPELFIEIPETATVGSLKRTVMEAVTAILGGGLRIGVHLQGKKVRDDSKTLLQAGISHSDELDSLGFTLEPNSLPSPKQGMPVDEDSLLIPKPLKRLPPIAAPAAAADSAGVPSPEDSKALVAVPAADAEALAIYPLSGKPRRLEAGPRRVRRPFSVYEVEALVRAVEKLGTGRWRDVKLCAFDSSKHRTYVDLKDKWKTLVHTARISPQRRRGEPVPQELLDRVLSAHAYWSQQQQQQQQQTKPEQVPRLA